MPVNFSGTWNIASHEDFTAILDKLQVPEDKRPPSKITNLQVLIEQDGDHIKIVSKTSLGDRVNDFTVGEPCKFVMFGNMPEVDVTSAWEGDRLVITDARGAKLIREIVGDQTVCTFCVGDLAVKLFYNKA